MAYPEVDSRHGDSPLGMGDIGLSDEDLVLLAELAKGVTVDRVGRRLDISGRTVRRRLRGICDRMGGARAIEGVAWAARRNLIWGAPNRLSLPYPAPASPGLSGLAQALRAGLSPIPGPSGPDSAL